MAGRTELSLAFIGAAVLFLPLFVFLPKLIQRAMKADTAAAIEAFRKNEQVKKVFWTLFILAILFVVVSDVTASLFVNVLQEDTAGFDLDLAGKIKFGTADESKALGTGENDYALQASLFKSFGAWGPYLDLGYRWKGDPAGADYKNVWYGSVGTGYRLNKAWSGGVDYSWRDKLTATSSPVSEATLYANYKLNDYNRINLYSVAGFSDASPDWGLGFTVTHAY